MSRLSPALCARRYVCGGSEGGGGEREHVAWPKWVVMMRSYNTENYRDNTNK